MESVNIKCKDEFIKLGQALKAAGFVENGGEAKFVINNGNVKVNGNVELMRGKKIYPGDVIDYDNKIIRII